MTLLRSVLMPCARLMTGLQPVARMPQPSSVPKNRYSTATTSTAGNGQHHQRTGDVHLAEKDVVVPDGQALIGLAQDLQVHGPQGHLGQDACQNGGDTQPDMQQARHDPGQQAAATAHSTASHRLRPLSSIMVQTAAPVQMEPSTVRSAMSSSL